MAIPDARITFNEKKYREEKQKQSPDELKKELAQIERYLALYQKGEVADLLENIQAMRKKVAILKTFTK